MPGSYPNRPGPDRPFVITPYLERAGKVMVPEMPDRCPAWASGSEPCRLAIHHWRVRKTGPRFPLAVVRCAVHGFGAFTLYPPSYAPYRRQAVLQVAPDGSAVHDAAGRLRGDFGGTLFEAAVDARDGRPWSRETGGELERSWGSQGRHLDLGSRLTGVARDLADRVREAISAVLSASTLLLREASRVRGYRAIGAAVCRILRGLRGGPRRAVQLLICGHWIGQWGEPLHWDADRRVLERSPFLAGGTTGAT
jgi:hypothetical protein